MFIEEENDHLNDLLAGFELPSDIKEVTEEEMTNTPPAGTGDETPKFVTDEEGGEDVVIAGQLVDNCKLAPVGTVNGKTGKSQLCGNVSETFGEDAAYSVWMTEKEKLRMVIAPKGQNSTLTEGVSYNFIGEKNNRVLFTGTLVSSHDGKDGLKEVGVNYGSNVRSYVIA